MRILAIALGLVLVSGLSWYFFTAPGSRGIVEKIASPELLDTEEAAALQEQEPLSVPPTERRDLTVSYELKVLAHFPQVTEAVARDICTITAGAGVCAWGSSLVTARETLAQKVAKAAFSVQVVPETMQLMPDLKYHIEIKDSSNVEPKYRMFVVHKDLLGRVDDMHEAHILAEAPPRADTRSFEWSLKQKYINESGMEVIDALRPGHYQVAVVDAASGRVSGISKVFIIGPYQEYKSDTTRFGANTPLANSYWTGKGVMFDGKRGEDVISFIGERAMYDIFKGVDLPDYADTLLFLQGGKVVITTVNVEIVKFDDVTIKVSDLIAELKANNGVLYRTKKFEVVQ